MNRISIRIEEYEMSDMFVEEVVHTTRLDLPIEALEKIMNVAQEIDNKDFIERLRRKIQDVTRLCKEKGYSHDIRRGEDLLLKDMEQLDKRHDAYGDRLLKDLEQLGSIC